MFKKYHCKTRKKNRREQNKVRDDVAKNKDIDRHATRAGLFCTPPAGEMRLIFPER